MPFDKNAFVADILAGAQVDDAAKAALVAALDNPVVLKNLEGATLRQGEFSKRMDDLNKKVKANEDYWANLTSWERTAKADMAEKERQLKQKLADEGVSLDDPNGKSEYMSKDDFQKAAQEYVAYANATATLQAKHLKEFGEILDLQKVVEVATKDGTNINNAYDILVAPKREEIRKADFEKQLATAREEGKAEAIKNYTMPANDIPNSPFPSSLNKEEGKEYGALAAVKAYNEYRKTNAPSLF